MPRPIDITAVGCVLGHCLLNPRQVRAAGWEPALALPAGLRRVSGRPCTWVPRLDVIGGLWVNGHPDIPRGSGPFPPACACGCVLAGAGGCSVCPAISSCSTLSPQLRAFEFVLGFGMGADGGFASLPS